MMFLGFAVCMIASAIAQPEWTARASAQVGPSYGQPAYKTFQPYVQPAAAVAKAVVVEPVVQAYKTFKPYVQPAAVAKTVVFEPVPVVQAAAKAVYTPAVVAKSYVNDAIVPIVRSESDVGPQGFNYVYETANGIAAEAVGSLKKVNNEEVVEVKGSYRYVAPDGTPVEFTYIANENGYQPQSNLLPVAPPVPIAIARSLEYIRARTSQDVKYNNKF